MTARIMKRDINKKVHKHIPYGRTYNNSNWGYQHYTKGYRYNFVDSESLEKGSKFIMSFLAKAIPEIKV